MVSEKAMIQILKLLTLKASDTQEEGRVADTKENNGRITDPGRDPNGNPGRSTCDGNPCGRDPGQPCSC
jgi:hypothetical protein